MLRLYFEKTFQIVKGRFRFLRLLVSGGSVIQSLGEIRLGSQSDCTVRDTPIEIESAKFEIPALGIKVDGQTNPVLDYEIVFGDGLFEFEFFRKLIGAPNMWADVTVPITL